MAPIPRCDLRLPSEEGRRSLQPSSADTDDADETTSRPKRPVSGHPIHDQRSQTRDSAQILEDAREFSTGVTRDMVEIMEHKQHEGRSHTRDSAEILEDASEFSTGVTRDMVEIMEHNQHEGIGGVDDPCTVLEQCRAEIEAEEAAAAAAVSDEEYTAPAAMVNPVATPGDVHSQFCKDRAESPSSGYSLQKAIAGGIKQSKGVKTCKGTYASMERYTSLLGSTKAMSARKKLELEMKKKRKYYEQLHNRNRKRREKEKRRAKEKRRMMRCRDQSKIPEMTENISINKAFYFRFNYNKQLPFMPSAMEEHFKKYKKPPFKHFHKGSRPCRKQVDEFEKLRVTQVKTGQGVTN